MRQRANPCGCPPRPARHLSRRWLRLVVGQKLGRASAADKTVARYRSPTRDTQKLQRTRFVEIAPKGSHHNLVGHSVHDPRIGLDRFRRSGAGSLEFLAEISILLLHRRLSRNHSGNTSTSGPIGTLLSLHAGAVRLTKPHRQFAARWLPRKSILSVSDLERSDGAYVSSGWMRSGPEPRNRFSRGFNRRWHRTAPLWQSRYKAKLIQDQGYLVRIVTYIHLNPVRAGLVEQPADYVFSGHRELMGKFRIEDSDFAADLESLDQTLSTKAIERLEELRTAEQES